MPNLAAAYVAGVPSADVGRDDADDPERHATAVERNTLIVAVMPSASGVEGS